MRVRRTWPVALLALAPVLAACDGSGFDPQARASDSPTESAEAPTSEPPTDTTTATGSPSAGATSSAAPAELPSACDLVTPEDLAEAYGVTFPAGGPSGGSTSENGVEWQSHGCSFEVPDMVEVDVRLTAPEDFTKGAFGCPQPSEIVSIVEPVTDVAGADQGWWKTSDSPPLEASLRACTAAVLVEVEIEYEEGVEYEGDPRTGSITIAEKVLAQL